MVAIKSMQGLGSRFCLLEWHPLMPHQPLILYFWVLFSLFFYGTAPSGQFYVGQVLTSINVWMSVSVSHGQLSVFSASSLSEGLFLRSHLKLLPHLCLLKSSQREVFLKTWVSSLSPPMPAFMAQAISSLSLPSLFSSHWGHFFGFVFWESKSSKGIISSYKCSYFMLLSISCNKTWITLLTHFFMLWIWDGKYRTVQSRKFLKKWTSREQNQDREEYFQGIWFWRDI